MIDNLGCDCPVDGCDGAMVRCPRGSRKEIGLLFPRDRDIIFCNVCGYTMYRYSMVSKKEAQILDKGFGLCYKGNIRHLE